MWFSPGIGTRLYPEFGTHHIAVRAVCMEMVFSTAAMTTLRLGTQSAFGGNVVGEFAAVVAAHAASPAISVGGWVLKIGKN